MGNFKIGQQVVCVDGDHWHPEAPPIKTGEIVTIEGFSRRKKYLIFKEKFKLDSEGERVNYYPDFFAPLIYNSAISEIFNKFSPLEERQDIEILIPSYIELNKQQPGR